MACCCEGMSLSMREDVDSTERQTGTMRGEQMRGEEGRGGAEVRLYLYQLLRGNAGW